MLSRWKLIIWFLFITVLAVLLPLALCSLDKTSVMLTTQFLPLGGWDLEDLVEFVTFLIFQGGVVHPRLSLLECCSCFFFFLF